MPGIFFSPPPPFSEYNLSMTTNSGYLVLARKWRPKTFDEVVGQQHIVRALKNAVTMNRMAGAYLFSGMRGVGKTSMARIFARSVNCEKGPTASPCGECKNCVEIAGGSSLDVVEIDAASNNGVDEIRDLRERVQYAPTSCRRKIYIIDEVHMLSNAAFNAFLKTLEEPPPHTIFIMATTEQHKIPETVLSRCQCFEFRPISEAQILGRLKEMAEREKINATPGALRMLARRAEGSMRDAQSLLDQASAYSDERLDEETLGPVLGLVSREKTWEVMRAVIARDVDASLKLARDLYYSGYGADAIIGELCEASRTLAVAKVSAAPDKILDEPPDMIGPVVEMVVNVSVGRLQQFYEALRLAGVQKSSGNPLSVLEMALIKMTRLDDVVAVSEILETLRGMPADDPVKNATDQFIGGRGVENKPPRPPAPSGNGPSPADEPPPAPASDDDWERVKAAVSAKKPMLGAVLEKARGFYAAEGRAVISYAPEQSLLMDQCEANRALIEAEMEGVYGKKQLLTVSSAGPDARQAPGGADDQRTDYERKVRREMLNHPTIQKAVELFDGRPGFDDETPGFGPGKAGGNGV